MPIWITVEGANILTRSMMIFGQGAIRCHPYVLKEMEAANLPDESERIRRFDSLLFQHIGYSIRNAVRSLILGMSFGRFAAVPSDRRTSRYYQKLSRYSASLAFISDVAMLTFGGKLKQKEHISARLGDVLSHLYICSAMLHRYEAIDRPAADQPILAWAFHDAVFKIQQALRQVVDNFPNIWMKTLLRIVIFPLGRRECAPGDRLTHRVAQLLLAPSESRSRLTNGVYTSARTGNAIGMMEQALPVIIAAEPLERKMLKAIKAGNVDGITWEEQLEQVLAAGNLTAEEAGLLTKARELVLEIIAVDEYESSELRLGVQHSGAMDKQHAA
jgi:acyl-CoA dehydrogenase